MTNGARPLLEVLERSRALGFLGPGPVEPHIDHARALVAVVSAPERFLDLGSGGGLPGLVAAVEWPDSAGALLDAHERRCRFLEGAVADLGLADRIEVVQGRAEELARRPQLRAAFDLVLARSFAPPAVTAECAAGFLRVGGQLVVSEPPGAEAPERWPAEGLAELGFDPAGIRRTTGAAAAIMELRSASDRWPRRTGLPAKRPVWGRR